MPAHRADIVCDCNVLFQALRRAAGPAAQILNMVESNDLTLHVSKGVLDEFRRIMSYPEIRASNPALTEQVVEQFLDRVRFRGRYWRDVPHVYDHPLDPKDSLYVDLAAVSGAEYLVTRDKHFRRLATDHSIDAKQFRQRFPGLMIVDPVGLRGRLWDPGRDG